MVRKSTVNIEYVMRLHIKSSNTNGIAGSRYLPLPTAARYRCSSLPASKLKCVIVFQY